MSTKRFLLVAFMIVVFGGVRYMYADYGMGSKCHTIVGPLTCDNVRTSLCESRNPPACAGTTASCTGGNTPSAACVQKSGNPPPVCELAEGTGTYCSGDMTECECVHTTQSGQEFCSCYFHTELEPCPALEIRQCESP